MASSYTVAYVNVLCCCMVYTAISCITVCNFVLYFHVVTSMDDEPALCRVSKQLMIHQLPPILILHMKRFEIGFYEVTKDDRHVSFPEILDMAPYCTSICLEVWIIC